MILWPNKWMSCLFPYCIKCQWDRFVCLWEYIFVFSFGKEQAWQVDSNYCKVFRETWKQPQHIKTCLKLNAINTLSSTLCYSLLLFKVWVVTLDMREEEAEKADRENWDGTKKRCIESACCGLGSQSRLIVDISVFYTQSYCQNPCQRWWCENA